MVSLLTVLSSFFISSSIGSDVLTQIGRLYIPNTDIPGAENSAIDTENNRIFVADGFDKSVNSFDFTIDDNITFADIKPSKNILLEPAFFDLGLDNVSIEDVTCVALSSKGYILATIVPMENYENNGWLAFIDPTSQTVTHLLEMPDCFLPDHVTSTYDGNVILVSCEGEPSDNAAEYPSVNPPGSVGYIDASSTNRDEWVYTNIGFTEFDDNNSKSSLLPKDIYYPLPSNVTSSRFSLTAEPEHIVVDFDDVYAYVSLQESNAIAVLDIAKKEIINVFTFGYADFSMNGGLDPSDKDGGIRISEYENLYSMHQPDDIDYFQLSNGRQFIFTANEGDSKDFDAQRIKKLVLNEDVFNDTDYLQLDALLGRLKVSNLIGFEMINETKVYNELYMFSSRDFSVFEVFNDKNGVPLNMSLHFSSNDDFERITAEMIPDGFNSDYEGNTFDERSDAKGPEPEGITVGECENGRLYVFICLERVGGVMVYDFTDIDNIVFADYVNNRDFSLEYEEDVRPPEAAGDIGPEQMRFIPEKYYGAPLLVVSHPQSASVTMYKIDCGEDVVVSTTMEPEKPDEKKEEELTDIEIVAIAIGSLAIMSVTTLIIYLIAKKRSSDTSEMIRTLNEFGSPQAQYVELES